MSIDLIDDNLCAQLPLIQSRRIHDENKANKNEDSTMDWGTCASEVWCCCGGPPGMKWYIHNESEFAKVGFMQIQEHYSGLDCRSLLWLNFNQRPGNTQAMCQSPTLWDAYLMCCQISRIFLPRLWLCNGYVSPSLIFWHRSSLLGRLALLPNGIGKYAVTVITICAQDSPAHLNIDHIPAEAAAFPWISEPCLILLHRHWILPRVSPCQIGLVNMLCWISHNRTQIICW